MGAKRGEAQTRSGGGRLGSGGEGWIDRDCAYVNGGVTRLSNRRGRVRVF